MTQSWRTEFPNFPVEDIPAIPATWSDSSWVNETCPSWTFLDRYQVYVDYSDPMKSELAELRLAGCTRFAIVDFGENFEGYSNDELTHEVIASDDWDEILECAKALIRQANWECS